MKITLDTSPQGCPSGCYLIVADDGRDRLVQTDWDYPGVASSFGWSVREVKASGRNRHCCHSGTDGTIQCSECGLTASDFIAAAAEWLDDNDGATADDPGYFD